MRWSKAHAGPDPHPQDGRHEPAVRRALCCPAPAATGRAVTGQAGRRQWVPAAGDRPASACGGAQAAGIAASATGTQPEIRLTRGLPRVAVHDQPVDCRYLLDQRCIQNSTIGCVTDASLAIAGQQPLRHTWPAPGCTAESCTASGKRQTKKQPQAAVFFIPGKDQISMSLRRKITSDSRTLTFMRVYESPSLSTARTSKRGDL